MHVTEEKAEEQHQNDKKRNIKKSLCKSMYNVHSLVDKEENQEFLNLFQHED